MSNLKLFGLSIVCTMAVLLTYFSIERWNQDRHKPQLTRVTDLVFLTSQLKPGDMPFLRREGIHTIVDMRPDGEADDQPSSERMKRAADVMGLEFHYIPVPHEKIPDEAVSSLQSLLQETENPAVLYCRTGRRAVRLFALASASQPDGPDEQKILDLVRSAGFDAKDLAENIAQRIASRAKTPPSQK